MTYSNTYSSPSSPTNFNPFSGMGMRKGGRPSLFPGSGDGSTLNLDFTTGVLDSRLTFSRASTATFVNSSGYVEYAGANLQRYSETFATTSSAWYHTNGTISTGVSIAPDGTTNCKKCSEPTTGTGAANMQLFGTAAGIVQGLSHTISMWVKAGTRSRILFSVDSASKQIGFDVTAGQTTPTPTVVTGSLLGYSQTPYPDNWYLCSFSWLQVNVSGSYPGFYTATGTGSTYTNSYTCDGSYIEIFGFQLNPGSTAQTYYPTTTAAYHAPRFDYSPTNIGEPRGLLVEGQGVNLALNSSTMSSSTYTVSESTLSTGSSNDPSNSVNAPKLTPNIGFSYSSHLIYSIVGVSNSTAYTLSIYAKANGYNRIGVNIAAGNRYTAVFDLTNGTFVQASSSGTPTGTSYAITPIGTNGWYRCSVTMTTADTTLYPHFMVVNDGTITFNVNAQATFVGDTSKSIYLWGAQLELGSGASSYIPTGASQVTRNADQVVLSNLAEISFNQLAGTMYSQVELVEKLRGSFIPYGSFDTTGGGRGWWWLRHNHDTSVGQRILGSAYNSVGGNAINSSNYTHSSGVFKFATSLDPTAGRMVYAISGGSAQITTATGFTLATAAQMSINKNNDVLVTETGSMWFRTLKYWPTALPDAQLTSITS